MTTEFQHYLQIQQAAVEHALSTLLQAKDRRMDGLFAAMNYSLLAGGKRIRPILLLAALDILGQRSSDYLPVACAIECVHTYSLIHDDLPCMDDDDYRRGKLTCHKKFTPGIATLAGDGLLTVAFEIIVAADNINADVKAELVRILAHAAGPNGMVGGQYIDIRAENGHADAEELAYMDAYKTGCLLAAPLVMAGTIAHARKREQEALEGYGAAIGLLFQIVDDLLDEQGSLEEMGKQQGRDRQMDKSTYVTMLGREEAYRRAAHEARRAQEILQDNGWGDTVLHQFPEYLLTRVK